MEILKALFFKKRSSSNYRKETIDKIRKNLVEYSCKNKSIVECVSNTGPLTAELIYRLSFEKTRKSVYDSILNMITNYYVMLYMDMYTGFYAVSRKHTCNLVSSLAEEILVEIAKKKNGYISNKPKLEIHASRDFTEQMVEVYYWAGIDGCHRYLASSIYSALLSENKNLSVKSDWIEHIVRAIQAEKFLTGSYNDEEFSLENTG